MTDKQHDTQKAAGELQGRARRGQREERRREDKARQPRNTQKAGAGAEDKRREGREERGTRMTSRLGGVVEEGSEEETRQQGGNRERADRQKKVCNIFKGEKREKTPSRLAKAYKCVHIHFTQYRGVSAVYCTFFYIY